MKSRCLTALVAVLFIAGCGGKPSQSATGSVHPHGWATQGPSASGFLAVAPGRTVAMFDSIDVSTVPHDPFALAGYVGGHWRTFLPMRGFWPKAHTVSIAISSTEQADCLDVEPGDATPDEVPGWVRMEKRAGWSRPCVYGDWSEFTTQIRPVLKRAGIHRWQVWEWDAFYNYRPHIDPGFDGTQWTDRCLGKNLDCSLVLRSFLSIAHPPLKPAPAPKPRPKPKPHPKPTPRPKPVDPRLQHLYTYRTRLRHDLIAQHCRGKHPNRHCRGVLKTGARVNREIRKLGGR